MIVAEFLQAIADNIEKLRKLNTSNNIISTPIANYQISKLPGERIRE